MQNFFVTPSQVEGDRVVIDGSDVTHMKNVLRMRCGERLMVSDGNNMRYLCEVAGYEAGESVLQILEEQETDTELP